MGGGGLLVVVALMQVSVEDPDVLVGLVAVLHAVPVVVVAAWRNLPRSPAGGRLHRTVVVVAAQGGGSCLLPPAAGDRELRPAARAGTPLGARSEVGLGDGRLQGDRKW